MIRAVDLLLSFFGFLLLSPLFLLIGFLILFTDGMPIYFRQMRVGKNGVDFELLKFRTMKHDAAASGLLTVGDKDPRVTSVGVFLRKYKLDELPQLINVIRGDMSLVGPRPEVRKYVSMYTEEQRKVLSVRPGITDMASIIYIDENEKLADSEDPEKTYVEVIMPHKLEINLNYIQHKKWLTYFSVIFKTLISIVR